MGIYLSSGYLDIEALDAADVTFNIVIGGRGTGKTYGALKMYLERMEPIIYMRRTDAQIKIMETPQYSPYKSVCRDLDVEFETSRTRPRFIYTGDKIIAFYMALNTFSNIRGFDCSECTAIVYDEFIPEVSDRPLKNEGQALLNAYETANRNRELNGSAPIKLWLFANFNRLDSPILAELGVLDLVKKLRDRGVERHIDTARSLQVVTLSQSPISEQKRETALYKLGNEQFNSMALSNNVEVNDSKVRSRNLKEFKPICQLDDLCIYKHKSRTEIHLCTHKTGNMPVYTSSTEDLKRFKLIYRNVIQLYLLGYGTCERIGMDYRFKELIGA